MLRRPVVTILMLIIVMILTLPMRAQQRVATVSAVLTVGLSHARHPSGNRTSST